MGTLAPSLGPENRRESRTPPESLSRARSFELRCGARSLSSASRLTFDYGGPPGGPRCVQDE
eukprot:scaffold3353_cov115-Pinguiococcus_pyrenoidosus.AAC.1